MRHRKEDIIPLSLSFLEKTATKYQRPVAKLSEDAKQALLDYEWPGNIRELSHVLERANILANGDCINVAELGLVNPQQIPTTTDDSINDFRTLDAIESDIIKARLASFEGNAVEAAKSLGLSRSAFYRRLEKISP